MLKDYVTVIVSMLLVVSIIGLVEIGNDSITGDSVTGMGVVEDSQGTIITVDDNGLITSGQWQGNYLKTFAENDNGQYTIQYFIVDKDGNTIARSSDGHKWIKNEKQTVVVPVVAPPQKSWWERFTEWLFGTKTVVGTGQEVGLKDLPSDAQGFVKELGGLVALVNQGVGKIVVVNGDSADEYLLPGNGVKALVVLSNIGEGSFSVKLISGEQTFVVKAKVKGTESSYGIGDIPLDLAQNPIDGFIVTDNKNVVVAQGPVNNILGQQPSRRAESRPFYCCKDGRGTEGTNYYEERNSREGCVGLVSKKCSDANGNEKEDQFIGSESQSEAARECVYGYKCINDKIAKLCGVDYTNSGASNTVEGAQPCPRPKVARTGDEDKSSCDKLCTQKGFLVSQPNYGSNILQSLESGNKFYCQDIAISFSTQTVEKCTCYENKLPTIKPIGTAVCENGIKCGEERDGKTCVFQGWELGEQGMPVAVVGLGE